MTPQERPLTPRQEAFVQEYLIDLNATQAATRAGYSVKTANEQGARLLANARVAARVAEAKTARAEHAAIDAQTVLDGLLIEARGNGPDTASSARTAAWKLIGQHVGMFAQKVELTGKDGGPVQLEQTIEAAAVLRAKLDALKERE